MVEGIHGRRKIYTRELFRWFMRLFFARRAIFFIMAKWYFTFAGFGGNFSGSQSTEVDRRQILGLEKKNYSTGCLFA